jgi:hypothetical protein
MFQITAYSRTRTPGLRRSIAVTLAVSLLALTAHAAPRQKQHPQKTPLTSVEAVTDLDAPRDADDPGTGGGIDGADYFSRKLAAKLNDCTAQIRSATDTWARANQLHVIKADQQPGNLLIHATRADLEGFFEITYRVKLDQQRARFTVFFYKLDGTQVEPAAIHTLLKTYKIDGFQDNLTRALLCGET